MCLYLIVFAVVAVQNYYFVAIVSLFRRNVDRLGFDFSAVIVEVEQFSAAMESLVYCCSSSRTRFAFALIDVLEYCTMPAWQRSSHFVVPCWRQPNVEANDNCPNWLQTAAECSLLDWFRPL